MTLEQKVAAVVGQWHGMDATERSLQMDKLVAELVHLIQSEMPKTDGAPTPFCAFCAPRFFAELTPARKRSAA